MATRAIGIVGGTGFYDWPDLTEVERIEVDTPYGSPSDTFTLGLFKEMPVVFLARHGRSHHLMPSEINARANICAFKMLGVQQLISVSAVGSLQQHIAPGDLVLPRQFIDRTVSRASTFFGEGVVAHVSFADPVCKRLADALGHAASDSGAHTHFRGTYLCIEGPQFSTRAESNLWRQWGADVVGMTGLPEARLAREAEMCYATLTVPTDYDAWRTDHAEVKASSVVGVLEGSIGLVRDALRMALPRFDTNVSCACHRSLDGALLTSTANMSEVTRKRLGWLLSRHLAE